MKGFEEAHKEAQKIFMQFLMFLLLGAILVLGAGFIIWWMVQVALTS